MEWRIFFIGPMGSSAGGKTAASDLSSHLPKLMDFVVDHLQSTHGYVSDGECADRLTGGATVTGISLVKGQDRILVLTPFALYDPADIPSNVFDAIDDSDLIIADLSGNKPAVIYELAFAHALGIRTIMVGGPDERSFYFSQTRLAQVNFETDPISSADLEGHLNNWLKDKNKRFDSPNPLTSFYGAPLPDISAAAGLGAGFYDNFARPILTDGSIIEKQPDGSEEVRALKGLIVLRPDNLDQRINQLKEALLLELDANFPKPMPSEKEKVKEGKQNEIFIRTREGPRIPFFLIDDWMIDIPRTMFSLALSPRLVRSVESKKNKALRYNMEQVLIERFFEAVKGFLAKDRNIEDNERRFHFGGIKEIPGIIRTGKSSTWD
jgi:hypothetical protein